jgi:hypothetical protein
MKSLRFWGYIYLFMGCSFIFLAIQQKARTGETDIFTIALMAIAAYDFMVAIKYLNPNPKKEKNKQD